MKELQNYSLRSYILIFVTEVLLLDLLLIDENLLKQMWNVGNDGTCWKCLVTWTWRKQVCSFSSVESDFHLLLLLLLLFLFIWHKVNKLFTLSIIIYSILFLNTGDRCHLLVLYALQLEPVCGFRTFYTITVMISLSRGMEKYNIGNSKWKIILRQTHWIHVRNI